MDFDATTVGLIQSRIQSVDENIKNLQIELRELSKNSATKEALKEVRDFFGEQFKNISVQLDAIKTEITSIKFDNQQNTSFRSFLTVGTRWIAGAIFVAIIGALVSMECSNISSHYSSTTTTTHSSSSSN